MKKGVDVSKWQGVMDWGVTAKRVDFAYIKACKALFTDPQFEANYQGAMAAGIPLGIYCYWDTKADWFAQTAYYLEIIKTHPAGLLPVIDMEMTTLCAERHQDTERHCHDCRPDWALADDLLRSKLYYQLLVYRP